LKQWLAEHLDFFCGAALAPNQHNFKKYCPSPTSGLMRNGLNLATHQCYWNPIGW
jgi:hypothetical protein